MLNNDFEKYIKDNLESARLDWDKDEMWNDIEAHLPQDEKPRRGALLWWIPVLFLCTTLGGVIYTVVLKKENPSTTTLDVQNQTINQKATSSLILENNNENIQHSELTVSDENASKNIVLDINTSQSISNENVNPDLNGIQKGNRNIKTDLNFNKINFGHQDQLIESQGEIDGKILAESEKNIDAINNKGKDIPKPFVKKHSIQNEIIDNDKAAFYQTKAVNWKALERRIIYIKNDKSSYLKLPFSNNNKSIIPHKKFRLNEVFAFVNYSLTNRTLTNLGDNETLLNARNKSEKVLESIGGQLGYRYFLNSHFYAEAIVEYRRINEVFDFEQKESRQIRIESDTANYYVSFTGESKYVAGESIVEQITTTPFVRYNEHHFVTLPIHIGYRKSIQRLDFDVILGPILNVYQSYNGDIINDNLLVDLDYKSNDFNNSLLKGIEIGINTNFNLGSGLAIASGLGFRKSFSSFTIDGLIDQSYNSLDFKLGVLYKI